MRKTSNNCKRLKIGRCIKIFASGSKLVQEASNNCKWLNIGATENSCKWLEIGARSFKYLHGARIWRKKLHELQVVREGSNNCKELEIGVRNFKKLQVAQSVSLVLW